jgi:hypothetical protein
LLSFCKETPAARSSFTTRAATASEKLYTRFVPVPLAFWMLGRKKPVAAQ